ncbi:MAG: hypothetical protein EOP83_15180 [Verrucomicrobiaceae bacterium]|nr:MAG: hypothetical protein EOP83_15180 [Verrucomicrobiaceae bacterium]
MSESNLPDRGTPRKGSQKTSGVSGLADLPEVAAVKRRRKRILWTFAALLLIGGISAKPGFAAVKRWRCGKLAEESAELLDRRDVEQAFSKARAAHQLLPEEPRALRAVAKALAARDDWGNAAAFWAEVVKREPSPEDRRAYAEAALRSGALDKAAEQVESLMSSDAESTDNHLLAAKVYSAHGDLALALKSARRAVELDPNHEVAGFLLSQFLLQKPETRIEGLERLWKLGEGKSATALQALLTLSAAPNLEKAGLDRLIPALRGHPLAEETHRLKALELELIRSPENRKAFLDAAQERYAAAEPERLRLFAAWLSLQGEHERALRVLPGDQAFTRKDLFLVRVDAMAALGQWNEILHDLKKDRAPLEQPLVHLFQARCWKELKDEERAAMAWRSALDSARGDVNMLRYIAGYAEKVGAPEQAERAYRALTQNSKTARFAFEALLRLTPPSETHRLRDLLAEMAQRWPKEIALTNDLAYLNTLLNVGVAENRATARRP